MEPEKKSAPVPPPPTTRKLTVKRKTATLDLSVPEGYEVERSWQVRDVLKIRETIDAELVKRNELFVITVRPARQEED
jgi:hypothetical protein